MRNCCSRQTVDAAAGCTQVDALTGLRFLAIVFVVVHHSGLFFPFVEEAGDFYGRQATSLFFVLSGFGLWCGYGQWFADGKRVCGFYVKRVVLLYPLYAISLLLAFAWNYFTGVHVDLDVFLSNALLLQSWIPFRSHYFALTFAGWFLSTLMSLYIAFPFICRYRLASFGIAIVSAFWGPEIMTSLYAHINVVADVNNVAYINPFCRLPDFCLGILIGGMFKAGCWRTGRAVSFSGAAVLDVAAIALLAGYTKVTAFQGLGIDRTLFLIPIFALLLDLTANDGPLRRLLSLRLFVFLGRNAFSIYLLHLPVRWFFFDYGLVPVKGTPGFAIYFVITLVVAVMVQHFVVSPLVEVLKARVVPRVERLFGRISLRKNNGLLLAAVMTLAAIPLWWYYSRVNAIEGSVVSNPQVECDSAIAGQFVEYDGGVFSIHPGEIPTVVTFDVVGNPSEISFDANIPDKRGDVIVCVRVDGVAAHAVGMSRGCHRKLTVGTVGARNIAIEVDKNGELAYDTVVLRNFRGLATPKWRNRR